MHKILKAIFAFLPFISIFGVFKLQSDYFSHQKEQNTKKTLLEIKQKIVDFKYLSLEDLDSKKLNSLYRINKQVINLTGNNFLESDLIKARDFLGIKNNLLKTDQILKNAQEEIIKKKGEIKDPIIRLRFESIENKLKILLAINSFEERLKRIDEIKEDVEMLKNDLLLQRKIKVEGSMVLRAFNAILWDLDQSSTILIPLLKYKTINEQIKKGLILIQGEINRTQNNLEKKNFNFQLLINFLSGIIVFLAFFVTYIVLKKLKKSDKGVEVQSVPKSEEEKNERYDEKIELKLQLNIIQEMLDQNIALINKAQEIVWCSRGFLDLFEVSHIEKLATKFSCSPPSWPEILASFNKTPLNRYQIKGIKTKEFDIETRKVNSLKYDEVVVIKPLGAEVLPLTTALASPEARGNIDFYRFFENWLGQNSQSLSSLNIPRECINLKYPNELVFININTLELSSLVKKSFEVFSLYFVGRNSNPEISISLYRDKKNTTKIQYFIPNSDFHKINENVTRDDKVYPSAVTRLREMENQFIDLGVKISLKHIYNKEKKLKGGMIVIELYSFVLPSHSQNKKNMARAV